MVTLLLNTGMRVSELADLKWTKVKMTARTGEIEVTGKGGKVRTIDLNPDAMKALKAMGWEQHKGTDDLVYPVSVRGIQWTIERYGRKAELGKLTVHMLRHTFAHDLLVSGTPLNVVQEMLGHESPATTVLYLTPSKKERREAVGRIARKDDDDLDDDPPADPPRRRRR